MCEGLCAWALEHRQFHYLPSLIFLTNITASWILQGEGEFLSISLVCFSCWGSMWLTPALPQPCIQSHKWTTSFADSNQPVTYITIFPEVMPKPKIQTRDSERGWVRNVCKEFTPSILLLASSMPFPPSSFFSLRSPLPPNFFHSLFSLLLDLPSIFTYCILQIYVRKIYFTHEKVWAFQDES